MGWGPPAIPLPGFESDQQLGQEGQQPAHFPKLNPLKSDERIGFELQHLLRVFVVE